MLKKVDVVKNILNNNQNNIAFIVGNGLNNYSANKSGNFNLSWEQMLKELWGKISHDELSYLPKGTSFTEFYDILELKNTLIKENPINLQKTVVELIRDWIPTDDHVNVLSKIRSFNAPLLTTNFDDIFTKALMLKRYRIGIDGFTDIYPWTTYFSDSQFYNNLDNFAIWHINGMLDYHRSIRLGLSHYMQSVSRVQALLHNDSLENLFFGKNQQNWAGKDSWLHIIFNKPLFIFGLGLEENETFLRWLLLQRKGYFKLFPHREQEGWYINKGLIDEGKRFYLEYVGFKIIEMEEYVDIYEGIWE